MSELLCPVCAEYAIKVQQALEVMEETKVESRALYDEAKRKYSRLLSAKHAHEAKQCCSLVRNQIFE